MRVHASMMAGPPKCLAWVLRAFTPVDGLYHPDWAAPQAISRSSTERRPRAVSP